MPADTAIQIGNIFGFAPFTLAVIPELLRGILGVQIRQLFARKVGFDISVYILHSRVSGHPPCGIQRRESITPKKGDQERLTHLVDTDVPPPTVFVRGQSHIVAKSVQISRDVNDLYSA